MNKPFRELFVWSVFFNRMSLAKLFWQDCPDQIGSAVVASLMLTKLSKEAGHDGKQHLADELLQNAQLDYHFVVPMSTKNFNTAWSVL